MKNDKVFIRSIKSWMITAQICKDSSGQFVNLPSSHPSEDLSSASQTSGKGRGKKGSNGNTEMLIVLGFRSRVKSQ